MTEARLRQIRLVSETTWAYSKPEIEMIVKDLLAEVVRLNRIIEGREEEDSRSHT